MRLADFILAHIEPILRDWEIFARSIAPGAKMDKLALRDHAEDILSATARDMISAQSIDQQSNKSKGQSQASRHSDRLDGASDVHAVDRVQSGFDLIEVVSEYRALRASVIRLWRGHHLQFDQTDLDDLTRFNESIDQSLAAAVRSFTQKVDRSRQMFLAILGHDLRNPLNSIQLSSQFLVQTAQPDIAEVASGIARSADAMNRMIADLLEFTGAGLGASMPIKPASMDLQSLCVEVVEEIRAAHPGCALTLQLDGPLTGNWDRQRLRQLLSNLLGNAVQHGDSACGVALTVHGDGRDVHIAVQNGGTPIPPDALATIFDPLVRGASPELQAQRRPGSIGLGLYIAREVVHAHSGEIGVTSSAESGTTFTVRLPGRLI